MDKVRIESLFKSLAASARAFESKKKMFRAFDNASFWKNHDSALAAAYGSEMADANLQDSGASGWIIPYFLFLGP